MSHVFCSGVEEIDPQQDVLMWSNQAVFKLQLCLGPDGQPVFNPTFNHVDTMAQAVLDGATRTTFDIPRIGTQMMVAGSASNNAGKTSSNSVPTMDLDDVQLKTVRDSLLLAEQGLMFSTHALVHLWLLFASARVHCNLLWISGTGKGVRCVEFQHHCTTQGSSTL